MKNLPETFRMVCTYAFLSMMAFLSLFPFVWMMIGATNENTDIVKGKLLALFAAQLCRPVGDNRKPPGPQRKFKSQGAGSFTACVDGDRFVAVLPAVAVRAMKSALTVNVGKPR